MTCSTGSTACIDSDRLLGSAERILHRPPFAVLKRTTRRSILTTSMRLCALIACRERDQCYKAAPTVDGQVVHCTCAQDHHSQCLPRPAWASGGCAKQICADVLELKPLYIEIILQIETQCLPRPDCSHCIYGAVIPAHACRFHTGFDELLKQRELCPTLPSNPRRGAQCGWQPAQRW